MPPLRYTCINRIPFGRGLGSSSAGIVSGLIAGLVLSGHEMATAGSEALLQIATRIEGHPDNVAPAIYGGIQIGAKIPTSEDGLGLGDGGVGAAGGGRQEGFESRYYTSRIRLFNGFQAVVFVPDYVSETAEARSLVPETLPTADACFNMSRIALLVNALSNGNLEELSLAFEDHIHQPPRGKVCKHLYPLIHAATNSGAHGAFLSGAGPSVMAITSGAVGDIYSQRQEERRDLSVAQAMIERARECGVEGRIIITKPTDVGAHVVRANPPFSEGSIMRFTNGEMI